MHVLSEPKIPSIAALALVTLIVLALIPVSLDLNLALGWKRVLA